MLSSSGSILQLRTGTGSVSALPSVNKPSSKQSILNAAPITRFNTLCSATKKSVNVIDKRFLGTRLRSSGSGRLHFWCSDLLRLRSDLDDFYEKCRGEEWRG